MHHFPVRWPTSPRKKLNLFTRVIELEPKFSISKNVIHINSPGFKNENREFTVFDFKINLFAIEKDSTTSKNDNIAFDIFTYRESYIPNHLRTIFDEFENWEHYVYILYK